MVRPGSSQASRLGWDEARLTAEADHRRRYEPLFVLVRNSTDDLPLDAGVDVDELEEEEMEEVEGAEEKTEL